MRPRPRPLRGRFMVPTQGGSVLYVCTKFEVDSSFPSKVIRGGPKFCPAADPISVDAGRPKFNQPELVTTFTYRPRRSMHAISSYRDNRPTSTQTQTQTHATTDRTNNNTLRC